MTFKRWILSLGIVVSTAFTAALSFEATAVPAPAASNILDGTLRDGDATAEISTNALRDALKDPRVVVLDARPLEEFAKSHIPGARSVPGLPGLSASKYTADANEVRRLVPDLATPLLVYCNGMYCGRSKRFGADLRKLGYTSVRRYQLGIPTWRALGGVTQVEKDALVALLASDSTAVLVDAREASDAVPRLKHARWIPVAEAPKAKDDGRLPMTDHNTRIFVVADNHAQARAAAEAIVRDAFHNVSFYGGGAPELTSLHEPVRAAKK
jgi:rhodanese-related sulfurtransferase